MCPGLTSRGGDHVLELAGVLAGLQHHLRAAQHGLCGEGEGDVAREARAHAAVRQRLDHEEDVGGAAAGQAGHCAQQLLVHLRPPRASAPAPGAKDGAFRGAGLLAWLQPAHRFKAAHVNKA